MPKPARCKSSKAGRSPSPHSLPLATFSNLPIRVHPCPQFFLPSLFRVIRVIRGSDISSLPLFPAASPKPDPSPLSLLSPSRLLLSPLPTTPYRHRFRTCSKKPFQNSTHLIYFCTFSPHPTESRTQSRTTTPSPDSQLSTPVLKPSPIGPVSQQAAATQRTVASGIFIPRIRCTPKLFPIIFPTPSCPHLRLCAFA